MFVCYQISDKAALLFRQYVKDSLYDRISTRPFLNSIEKKWLAFQLLCAINQCHKLQVSITVVLNSSLCHIFILCEILKEHDKFENDSGKIIM